MADGQKKILYVASSFGHLAAFHQPYMKWFAEQGCTVHAAAGGDRRELQGVVRYISLPFEKSMYSQRNLAAAWRLRQLVQREGYDLISLHTSLAAFFARLALLPPCRKRPTVMNTSHGYLFDRDSTRLKRMMLLGAERLTAPVTDWLLVMNQQDREIANRYRLGKNIVFTRGMGVDLARFQPATREMRQMARDSMRVQPDELVLVYAAEFSERKNQKMLIRAMQDLPDSVILLLPGEGALLEPCKMLAKELGVSGRVRFPGFVRNVEDYYAAADLCVSASRIEGLPFNVMEAMACGLPVVLSDIKGHQDLVSGGQNGILYPYDDIPAFVKAVERLLDEQTRQLMAVAAYRAAQPYGLETVYPTLTGIYQTALHGHA